MLLLNQLFLLPQLLENSKSHSNACNTLISSKKKHLLNRKGIDDSTENMSGIIGCQVVT